MDKKYDANSNTSIKIDSPISSSSLTVKSGSRNCSFSNNIDNYDLTTLLAQNHENTLYSNESSTFFKNSSRFSCEISSQDKSQDTTTSSKNNSSNNNNNFISTTSSRSLPALKSFSFDNNHHMSLDNRLGSSSLVLLGGTPQLRKNSSNNHHTASVVTTRSAVNNHDNNIMSTQNSTSVNNNLTGTQFNIQTPPPLQMLSTNPSNNNISTVASSINNTSVFENSKSKQNFINLDALNRLNQVIGGFDSNDNEINAAYNNGVFNNNNQSLKYADSFDSQYFRNAAPNQAISNNTGSTTLVGRKRRVSSKNKSADLVDKSHLLPVQNDHLHTKSNLLLNIEKSTLSSNNSHFQSIHDSDPSNYHLNDATTATINSFIGDNHASILSNDEQITKFFNNEDKKIEQGVGLVDPFNPEDHHFDPADKKFDGIVDLGARVLDMPNKQDLHSQIQHHSSTNQQLIDGNDFFNSLGNQHNNLNDNDILSFAINNGFHQNQNAQYSDESAPFLFNLDGHQNALNNVDPSALRFFSAPNSQLISASSDIQSQLGDSNLYNENSLLDNSSLYHHQQNSSKPKKPRNRVVRDERRRNFHNEIERNRRTKINNLINGLAMLVPDLKSAIESSRGVGTSGYPSKGKILSRTVEFINELIGQCQYIEGLVNKVNSLSSELEAYKSHHSSCFQYHPNYHLKKDPSDGDNSDTTNKN